MTKTTTIKDIAQRAGVSVSTVSRVINGNYPVNAKTQILVENAIAELNYSPNFIAQSLRNNRTNSVGLIVPDIANHFFMDVANGLEVELKKHDFLLVIASSGGKKEQEEDLVESLISKRMDAIVMIVASADNSGKGSEICINKHIPLFLIDRGNTKLQTPQVLWNNFKATYDMADVLIKNGHRDIALVNISLNSPNGIERLNGAITRMKEAGIEPESDWISRSNLHENDAYSFVIKVMNNSQRRPSAIICANNIMLEGALKALNDLHLQIGVDVSVVAFGSLECNKFITPQITHSVQNGYLMGQITGNLVAKSLQKKTTQKNFGKHKRRFLIRIYFMELL